MDEGDTRNCKDITSRKERIKQFFTGIAYSRQMKPANGCTESRNQIPFVEIELRVRNELKT
jgi:hypothetical protein